MSNPFETMPFNFHIQMSRADMHEEGAALVSIGTVNPHVRRLTCDTNWLEYAANRIMKILFGSEMKEHKLLAFIPDDGDDSRIMVRTHEPVLEEEATHPVISEIPRGLEPGYESDAVCMRLDSDGKLQLVGAATDERLMQAS